MGSSFGVASGSIKVDARWRETRKVEEAVGVQIAARHADEPSKTEDPSLWTWPQWKVYCWIDFECRSLWITNCIRLIRNLISKSTRNIDRLSSRLCGKLWRTRCRKTAMKNIWAKWRLNCTMRESERNKHWNKKRSKSRILPVRSKGRR